VQYRTDDEHVARQQQRHARAAVRSRVRLARVQAVLAVPFFAGLLVALLECTKPDPNDWLVMLAVAAMVPLLASLDVGRFGRRP